MGLLSQRRCRRTSLGILKCRLSKALNRVESLLAMEPFKYQEQEPGHWKCSLMQRPAGGGDLAASQMLQGKNKKTVKYEKFQSTYVLHYKPLGCNAFRASRAY